MTSSVTGTFLNSPFATIRTGWSGTTSSLASWRTTRSACAELAMVARLRWMVRIWTAGSTGFVS